jgi:hypothetical protein
VTKTEKKRTTSVCVALLPKSAMSYDDHLIDSTVTGEEQLNADAGYATSLKFYEKSIGHAPYDYARNPYDLDVRSTADGADAAASLFGESHNSLMFSVDDASNDGGSDVDDTLLKPSQSTLKSAPAVNSHATTTATANPTTTAATVSTQQPPLLALSTPSVNWTSDLIDILDDGIAAVLGPGHEGLPVEQLIMQCRLFSNLANNFLSVATGYAKIIVSEVGLAKNDKTIKPIDIGGEAGGEKYLAQGILFKFATDWHHLYG